MPVRVAERMAGRMLGRAAGRLTRRGWLGAQESKEGAARLQPTADQMREHDMRGPELGTFTIDLEGEAGEGGGAAAGSRGGAELAGILSGFDGLGVGEAAGAGEEEDDLLALMDGLDEK